MAHHLSCNKRHEEALFLDPSIIQLIPFACPLCYLGSGGLFKASPEISSIVLESLRSRNPPRVSAKINTKGTGRFTDKVGKKFENFRQSLIRFFKKCMKKLDRTLAPIYSKREPENTLKYKKGLKIFRKMYALEDGETEDYHHVFSLLKSLSTAEEDIFEGDFARFKTCNNAYAQWFFSHLPVRELYAMHHQFTQKSDVYYKILKLDNDVSEPELNEFISDLPSSI